MSVTLRIESPGQAPTEVPLATGEYAIGRDEACLIRLRHDAISGHHASLFITEALCQVADMGSANGTLVDGESIAGRTAVGPSQPIELGPFTLSLPDAPTPKQETDIPKTAPAPAATEAKEQAPAPPRHPQEREPQASPDIAVKRQLKTQIHRELVKRLDMKRLSASRLKSNELERRARDTIQSILKDVRQKLPARVEPAQLEREVFNEAMRLGPLEDFLEDESITEIMINGPHKVYVERAGRLELTDQTFMDNASVLAIIERIVSPLGRRIDESSPYVDARLADGSRVNAIISPLSLIGPCLTIRKFSKHPLTDEDLIGYGTFTRQVADFLHVCIQLRKNIVVSGGTGSGKTTLLNVLGNYLPSHERIVTIEDAAELRLEQPHVVRLEARPPNIEGKGAITIRDLVRNSLRMRPDRIIVGECRGGEALDMLQAMNTGHDGSLTTIHANAPRDVISRLETMVMMSGMELPSRAIREQIGSAIDVIVHENRMSDGSRKITCVSEIVGLEGNQITMQDIFEYRQTGIEAEGKVVGSFGPTGSVPTFMQELRTRGLELDQSMFQPNPEGAETS